MSQLTPRQKQIALAFAAGVLTVIVILFLRR
jgi:hypothetical protein